MSRRAARIAAALVAVTAGAGMLAAAPLLANSGPERNHGSGHGPPLPAPPAQGQASTAGGPGQLGGPAFRVTCDLATTGIFDPIVFPKQKMAGHLHQFFGNTSISGMSTTASLVAANATGDATTCSDPADGAAYWVPTLQADGQALTPDEARITYRWPRGQGRLRAFPVGFKTLAGDKTATTLQTNSGWRCESDNPTDTPLAAEPPACDANEDIVSVVTFPNCWDGVNAATRNQSHMAFRKGGTCPTTHPVAVPELQVEVLWPSDGMDHAYTLSSGNTAGLHADFMNGWNQRALRRQVSRLNSRGAAPAQPGA